MTFKIHDNDKTTVSNLMSKLHDNGIDIWIQMNMNDMSDCKWRFLDSPNPNIFGTMDQPLHNGGIGALINDMKEACFNHGIMKRPTHISNRNSNSPCVVIIIRSCCERNRRSTISLS